MKKLTLLKTISPLFSAMITTIFIISCSSESKLVSPQKKYSTSTENEFEAIEKTDLQKRISDHPVNKIIPRRPVVIKEALHEKPKVVIKQPTTAPVLNNEAIDTSQLSTKNQERLQEINQNLAFFCMKHRKDASFQDEEHCLAFAKKVLTICEKKHKLINTVMVNCIKDRLKKKQ